MRLALKLLNTVPDKFSPVLLNCCPLLFNVEGMETHQATNHNLNIEDAINEGRKMLEKALYEVNPGAFIEIERYTSRGSVSLVAHRYTGDMDAFKKLINFSFNDAAEALLPGQKIKVTINE